MVTFSRHSSLDYSSVPLYEIQKSFIENVTSGPKFDALLPTINRLPPDQWIDVFGYKIASPLGVPACSIMFSRGIALAARLGFDVLVYKTIRSVTKKTHSYPNIVYVDTDQISINNIGTECTVSNISVDRTQIAIANSFGNGSFDSNFLRDDIAKAKMSLLTGQVLIVSVFGESLDEFVQAALLAKEAGADIIELNFSCPNLESKTVLYLDSAKVGNISRSVMRALGHTLPITIKVGVFNNFAILKEVLHTAARVGIRGICGINSVPMRIMNKDNTPAFGTHRTIAGVSGNPIRSLALEFVRTAQNIITKHNLNLIIFGTGGITMTKHFHEFLVAGATIAMSATGFLWNPYLAAQYHNNNLQQILFSTRPYNTAIHDHKRQLAIDLFNIGAIKFGNFTLKCGRISPLYVDLRLVISHPTILHRMTLVCKEKIDQKKETIICGVPYAAVPLATALSLETNMPMIMLRKELKEYGTKKLIEGTFIPGQQCILIEDVITTGGSILEAAQQLERSGLSIAKMMVIVDRQQGGTEKLMKQGYHLDTVFTLHELLTILYETHMIDQETYQHTCASLSAIDATTIIPAEKISPHSFVDRAEQSDHPIAKKLFMIMETKATNLVVAADVRTKKELLQLADLVGPDICMLKTHMDIVDDFDQTVPEELKKIALKHNFLLWEDRKFSDIGAITVLQCTHGMYRIADWADVISVHAIAGQGTLDAIKQIPELRRPACLLVAQMSSKGALTHGNYVDETIQLAEQNPELVIGFVCQKKLAENPALMHCTPGVQYRYHSDSLGQQYLTPEKVLIENRCDLIIVGRGITQAQNPKIAANEYKNASWHAYTTRQSLKSEI